DRLEAAGSWSVYWYNGVIVNSEIGRGLDIFELVPSEFITQNEIDAAKTVRQNVLNPQGQPTIVWPASFAKAKAYLDQLERDRQLNAQSLNAFRTGISGAEGLSGSARATALNTLAGQVDAAAAGSGNTAKVRDMAATLRALAN